MITLYVLRLSDCRTQLPLPRARDWHDEKAWVVARAGRHPRGLARRAAGAELWMMSPASRIRGAQPGPTAGAQSCDIIGGLCCWDAQCPTLAGSRKPCCAPHHGPSLPRVGELSKARRPCPVPEHQARFLALVWLCTGCNRSWLGPDLSYGLSLLHSQVSVLCWQGFCPGLLSKASSKQSSTVLVEQLEGMTPSTT